MTAPSTPQTWVDERRRATIDGSPELIGTVVDYIPAVVRVQLDAGGVTEVEPERLTVGDPAPTDEQITREQVLAALGNTAKVKAALDALEAAGIRLVRTPQAKPAKGAK